MDDFKGFVDEVKSRVDIVNVIGRDVQLNSRNVGLCPFPSHKDSKPSFSVNQTEGYFKCFGCGRGGDVFKYLEELHGIPFMEALQSLAVDVGLEMPNMAEPDRQQLDEERTRQVILNETATYYQSQLTAEAKKYLESRGFGEDLIREYRLGYADGTLAEYLIDGCSREVDQCVKAGVLVQDENGQVRDYFYNRVIFPNTRRGQVVHFTGRTLDGSEPRYKHLAGEVRHLYNEDALANKQVVLAEGIPDCLSAIQAGFPAVGVLGTTSFKPEYVAKFGRCDVVYVVMDNDDAGREAAVKIGSMLGKKARIVELLDVNDLNDYFHVHGKDDFAVLLKEAKDIYRHRIYSLPADTDRVELPNLLEPVLKDLAVLDRAQAEAYLQDIKRHFNLTAPELTAYRATISETRKSLDDGDAVQLEGGQQTQMTAKFPGLVDLVDNDGKVAFLVKQDGGLAVLDRVESEGTILIPPHKACIRWMLPRAEAVIGYFNSDSMKTDQFGRDLYRELEGYHRALSELPSEDYYGFLALWDIHTYFQEFLEYSPTICFSALHARGKTRTGAGITYVAYRGIIEQSLREANVMRFADYMGATLFFDIRDLWKRLMATQSDDILMGRFEKKSQISRVLYPDRGPFEDMKSFNIFGPTIVSSNEAIDHILESRCITLNMRETQRNFNNDVVPDVALPLREKLVAFRAKHIGTGLPVVTEKPAKSRLGDILKPLYQVLMLVNPEGGEQFIRFAAQLDEERKMNMRDTWEVQILNAIRLLEPRVNNGILAVSEITDTVNMGKPDRHMLTAHKVAGVLRSMGFRSGHMPNGSSGVMWEQGVIDSLCQRYDVN